MQTKDHDCRVLNGLLSVNLAQMERWQVDAENVRFYDAIMRGKGTVLTLDARTYVDLLCGFNIFFTLKSG